MIYKTGNYSLEGVAKAATSILGYLASRRTIYQSDNRVSDYTYGIFWE